jgi:hypothetical protein
MVRLLLARGPCVSPQVFSPPGFSPPGISPLRIRRKQERKNDQSHRRRSDKDAGSCPPATSEHYSWSETHLWTLRGFQVQDFTIQKGRAFPLTAPRCRAHPITVEISPRPGRFVILNRNRAKHHGITVPSTNFFEQLNPRYAKIPQWADSLFRRPGAIYSGPARPPDTTDRSKAVSAHDANSVP